MKTVAIIGMGRSGQSAAKLALSLHYTVHCVDSNNKAVHVKGCHHHYGDPFDVSQVDELIVSPGVPINNTFIQTALQANIPVKGELGFASQHIQKPLLAITGTNGKSSTAYYTKQLLEQCGYKTFIGGNFGIALSHMALYEDQYDIGVVEVSSYQMEFPNGFSPLAAVALNLTPDHLKRHKTMEVYGEMKRRIFAAQGKTQYSISPKDGTALTPDNFATKWSLGGFPGAKINSDQLHISTHFGAHQFSLQELQLLGYHNKENIAAAVLLIQALGTEVDQLNLQKIKPLEHRLETVYERDGVVWVNDSKATNIEATIAGVKGIGKKQILLLGGKGKAGANYRQLSPMLKKYAQEIICFGASAHEIATQLNKSGIPIHQRDNLFSAVRLAKDLATKPIYVVLSPACASFDEFTNFEERGHSYKQIIHNMMELS